MQRRNRSKAWLRLLGRFRHDSGQSLVLVALMLVVLLGFTGLAVNVGNVYYVKGRLQDAVDAAALAGAQVASQGGSSTQVAAQSALITKDAGQASGTVGIDSQYPSLVNADATQTVSGGFAALFGFHSFTVRAHAAAQFGPGEVFNYAVFSGSPSADLHIGGSVDGNIHTNDTVSFQGGTTVNGGITAVSGISGTPEYGQYTLNPRSPSLAMPTWNVPAPPSIASLPAPPPVPSTAGSQYVTSGNVPSKWGETYNQSIYVTGGGSANLSGGNTVNGEIFVQQGGGVQLGSQVTVSGPIYVTGGGSVNLSSNDNAEGGIYVNGGSVTVQGNSDSVTGNVVVIGGNATINANVSGSIYVTGGGSVSIGGGVTIGGGIYVSGGGSLSVGGGDSVGTLPASAFPGHSPIGMIDDGGYGVTSASISVAGSGANVDVGGDVIDVGSSVTISGGINVNGNLLDTAGNGSSNCGIHYGGGGKVNGYVIDQGGSISLGGSTTSGTEPGLTVADLPYNHNGTSVGGSGIAIGGGGTFTGILYAPVGSISLTSNPVVGAIVGKTLSLGWTSVTYNASVVDSAPFGSVALVQ